MDFDPTKEEKALKPCPFCGGKAEFTDPDWEDGYKAFIAVWCPKCTAKDPVIKFHIYNNCGGVGSEWRLPYETKAATLWNTRAGEK